MMSIRESEEELFQRWGSGVKWFVKDGVIDEEAYQNSEKKILLILKEVNDQNGGGWDLRSYVKNGGRSQTWDTVTRWLMHIREIDTDIPWSTLEKISNDQRIEQLKSIAVMNLKKSPGTHTAIHKDVSKVAHEDRDYLNEQFKLYKPDLVICCGTSWIFHEVIKFVNEVKWSSTTRGVRYHTMDGTTIIDYAHPEVRCSKDMRHYPLIDALREIAKVPITNTLEPPH